MALGLTQPLTEMSTRNTSYGGRCTGLTTLPPSCADCLKIWEPQPPGLSRPVMGLLYLLLRDIRRGHIVEQLLSMGCYLEDYQVRVGT